MTAAARESVGNMLIGVGIVGWLVMMVVMGTAFDVLNKFEVSPLFMLTDPKGFVVFVVQGVLVIAPLGVAAVGMQIKEG